MTGEKHAIRDCQRRGEALLRGNRRRAAYPFIHEFAGDWRRGNRRSAISAGGVAASSIRHAVSGLRHPGEEASYSQDIARDDALAVLDHLGIDNAHIVGLSMGGFATLHFGIAYADRALSLTICGCGYGAEPSTRADFRALSLSVAENFETRGAADFAEEYVTVPGRLTFKQKDPRGWAGFVSRLQEHSDIGSALTQRGVQASRPGLWDLENRIKAISVPSMIVTGDDDQRCLAPSLFMKELIEGSRLFVMPHTGHVLNLEEPKLFNTVLQEFLDDVEAGKGLVRGRRAQTRSLSPLHCPEAEGQKNKARHQTGSLSGPGR